MGTLRNPVQLLSDEVHGSLLSEWRQEGTDWRGLMTSYLDNEITDNNGYCSTDIMWDDMRHRVSVIHVPGLVIFV